MDSGVLECRCVLADYVQARVGEVGRKRAVAELSARLGWSTRRVLAMLHGEVRRVWWDEVETARAWHRAWCDQESRRLDARAALLRARHDAREGCQHERVVASGGLPGRGTDVGSLVSAVGPGGDAGRLVGGAAGPASPEIAGLPPGPA